MYSLHFLKYIRSGLGSCSNRDAEHELSPRCGREEVQPPQQPLQLSCQFQAVHKHHSNNFNAVLGLLFKPLLVLDLLSVIYGEVTAVIIRVTTLASVVVTQGKLQAVPLTLPVLAQQQYLRETER
jgi:hypothetical protein